MTSPAQKRLLMPAEWEPHAATWIAWPHNEPDWPGKLEAVHWAFVEVVRALVEGERVEILCHDGATRRRAVECLRRGGVPKERFGLHTVPNDRCWVRDSGPTAVLDASGEVVWIRWRFNAWARYDNWRLDAGVAAAVARLSGLEQVEARRPGGDEQLVLEGGALDTDGDGTVMVTEECLLSGPQARNPGLSRADYERILGRYLGARRVIWLAGGCAGDDTGGHVDDVARFVGPATVALAHEPNPADEENHRASEANLARLRQATDARGRPLRVVTLPMPRPLYFDGERLPASYANFYIANGRVLVPTFNDPADGVALGTLAELFPDRQVIGIHAVDLVWGFGALHCLTQQQPLAHTHGRT